MTILTKINTSKAIGSTSNSIFEDEVITVDPSTKQLKIYDGVTQGGKFLTTQGIENGTSNITVAENSTININVNSGNLQNWTYNTNGTLTFPGGALVDSADNNLEVRSINNFNVEATNDINLYTGGSGNKWTFGSDAVLTIPGAVYDANSLNTIKGEYGFRLHPAHNTGGTGPELYISYNDGIEIAAITNDYYIGNTSASPLYISGASTNVTGKNPGSIIIEAGVNTADTSYGNITLRSGSKLWQFTNDGNLTVNGNIAADNIGNISSVNLDGNVSNVLAGDGSWVAQSGGTSLPTNASGYLANDGSGTLSWVPGNPSGSGMLPYSEVIVNSDTVVADWTEFTLTGTMDALWDYSNTYPNLTLSGQSVYGKTLISNTKILIINDDTINGNDYGIVIEFPETPAAGDVISALIQNDTVDVNAGSFVVGKTYTIKTVGTTNWTSIGATFSGIGQSFVATGAGSGTGVATTVVGATKAIFKPATGQRGRIMGQGGVIPFYFGQGGSYDFVYLDMNSQNSVNPITWVYAGVIGGVPTWYQSYF